MNQKTPIIDVEPSSPNNTGREGDGKTYLVVADDSAEFAVALKYGCSVARRHRGHVGILYVVDNEDFQQWGAVEARIQKEKRLEAEKYIWSVAKTAHEYNNSIPSLYFAEGDRGEAVMKTIEENPDVAQLILGGSTDHNSNAGPLISWCLSKGISRLRVPLVVVPGHAEEFS